MKKEIVRPGSLRWFLVGDRQKIESGVRKLGLGELHLLDAEGSCSNK